MTSRQNQCHEQFLRIGPKRSWWDPFGFFSTDLATICSTPEVILSEYDGNGVPVEGYQECGLISGDEGDHFTVVVVDAYYKDEDGNLTDERSIGSIGRVITLELAADYEWRFSMDYDDWFYIYTPGDRKPFSANFMLPNVRTFWTEPEQTQTADAATKDIVYLAGLNQFEMSDYSEGTRRVLYTVQVIAHPHHKFK